MTTVSRRFIFLGVLKAMLPKVKFSRMRSIALRRSSGDGSGSDDSGGSGDGSGSDSDDSGVGVGASGSGWGGGGDNSCDVSDWRDVSDWGGGGEPKWDKESKRDNKNVLQRNNTTIAAVDAHFIFVFAFILAFLLKSKNNYINTLKVRKIGPLSIRAGVETERTKT